MMVRMMPGMDYYVAPVVMVRIRFGRWDELLALKDPGAEAPYLRAMWRYGRALAFAAKGQPAKAVAEQRAFEAFVDAIPAGTELGPLNSARAIMAVARASLEGELALRAGRLEAAIPAFARAVKAEDALGYDEPPPWFLSPRQELGYALLKAHRAAEAEAVYREDLERYRENGWSLFGLRQALAAQKKPTAAVGRRFRKAWAHADVTLTGSIF
jgi:tetratricopeptide (TPR) repeat protein